MTATGTTETRLSIGTWAFGPYATDPLPFDEMLDRLAVLGFDAIELGAFAPHPTPRSVHGARERTQLRASIEKRGLRLSAVAATFDGVGFLQSDDATGYFGVLNRNLEFCDDLGADRLLVHTIDSPQIVEEIGRTTAVDRTVRVWRRAADIAAARGIELAWEFEPCWALSEPDDIVEIADALEGPGFGVLYDTAHAHLIAEVGAPQVEGRGALEGGQVELLRRLEGRIKHVHLLDSDGTLHDGDSSSARTTVHVPFEYGHVRFEDVIPALVAAGGLTPWWTVDLCFWKDPWGAAELCRRYVQELLTSATSESAGTSAG